MKDLWGAYGKVGGIAAGAGLLLSFLTGLASGNPFGTVILRALLFALLFGGLGVGAQIVLGRFLPELKTGEGGTEAPGKGVDIVLPEENPHAPPEGVRVVEPAAGGEDGIAESAALSAGGEGAASDLAPPEEEGAPGAGGPEPPPAGGETEPEAAPAGSARPAGNPAEAGGTRAAAPFSGLDSMEGSFAAPSGGGSSAMGRPRPEAGGLAAEDPATIARAIRTVLKKDEKG